MKVYEIHITLPTVPLRNRTIIQQRIKNLYRICTRTDFAASTQRFWL